MSGRFYAGDYDVPGSPSLEAEIAALDPGRHVGDVRHVDEVERGTVKQIHVVRWDGERWAVEA